MEKSSAVKISVPEGPYRPGSVVPFSVENAGDQVYTWNPCVRTLVWRRGKFWVGVEEKDRFCTAEAWVLQARGRADAKTDIPANLKPGRYRLRYSFSRESGTPGVSDLQVSNDFIVAGS
jgi:hypothetical protein